MTNKNNFSYPVDCSIARYTAVSSVKPLHGPWSIITVFGSGYEMLYRNNRNDTFTMECGQMVLHVPLGSRLAESQTQQWNVFWHCNRCNVIVPTKKHNFTSMGAISLFNVDKLKDEPRNFEHIATVAPLQYSIVLQQETARQPLLVDAIQNPNLLSILHQVKIAIHLVPQNWMQQSSFSKLQKNNTDFSCISIDGIDLAIDASIETESGRKYLTAQQLYECAKQSEICILPCLTSRHVGSLLKDFLGHQASREFQGHILLQRVSEILPADCIGIMIRPFDNFDLAIVNDACPYFKTYLGAFVPRINHFI